MLIRDILVRNARIYPNRVALLAGAETLTHRQLWQRACHHASLLRSLGIGKGDRVAILAHNTALYVELLFAVTMVGGVLVPLNYLLIGRELKVLLKHSDARAFLFDAEFEGVVSEIRSDLPSIAHFLCIADRRHGFDRLDDEDGDARAFSPDDAAVRETDVAMQVYTSGPSGKPLGAMLSHRSLMAASASAALELGLSRNDIYLSSSPLPFIAGTGRLLRFLYVGGTIVLLRDFDPAGALEAIERERVTHALFTPTMMARIMEIPEVGRYNLASLRTITYGGTAIPLDLLRRAIRFFGCAMAQSHGQVESSGVLTFLHPEDHVLDESSPHMRKLMSVGQEAIGVEVRVVDESGKEIQPNQVGEVIARGLNIFEGYYRDPATTAEVLRNGWLYTGEVASVDEEGYIYIVDRKRETMMIGGISVSPREIEDVLMEFPAVREAAVVGRPDYTFGEIPIGIVALHEGAASDRDALLDHCRRNMAGFKVPREIEFVTALPRNSQGKVLKVKLKERMVGRSPRIPRR